jgi:HPt (histidine-containing phosphotransfer) domain-containing protein
MVDGSVGRQAEARGPRRAGGARPRTDVERALEAEYGPQLVFQLRAAFDADLDGQLGAAAGALAAGDLPALARAAHRIKGGAAALGEHGLERAAAALEAAAKQGGPARPALEALIAAAG